MTNARAIKAGRGFIELFLKDNAVLRGMRRLQAASRRVGVGIAAIGGGITALGGTLLAPIIAATLGFAEMGDQIQKTAQRTGASAEFLSQMGFAAEQSGTSFQSFSAALFRSTRRIANAASATGPAVRALKELNLNAVELSKLSTEEQFFRLVKALEGVPNPARRAQLGFEVFGDNIRDLTPLLNAGEAGIKSLMNQLDDFGGTLTGEQVAAASRFKDAWNEITIAIKAGRNQIGAAFASDLAIVLKRIANVVGSANRWVKANRQLVVSIAKIAGGLVLAGSAITAIGLGIITFGAAVGSVVTIASAAAAAFAAIGTAIAAIVSPIGLAVVAFGALTALVINKTGVAARAIEIFAGVFEQLKEDALLAFKGISDALAAGDIQAAAAVLWKVLNLEWQRGINALNTHWQDWKKQFIDVAINATTEMVKAFVVGFGEVSKAFNRTIVVIQTGWDAFVSTLKNTYDNLTKSNEAAQRNAAKRALNDLLKLRSRVTEEAGKTREIDEAAAKRKAAVDETAAELRRSLEAKQAESLKKSAAELEKAKNEFTEQLSKNAAARKKAENERPEETVADQVSKLLEGVTKSVQAVSVAPTFSGKIAEQIFGTAAKADAIGKQNLEQNKEVAKNTAKIEKNTREGLGFV